MNNLLDKKLNELTEEEKKQVQQFLNKKKPSVPFSKATLNDKNSIPFIEPIAVLIN
jgi:hypothetical protein